MTSPFAPMQLPIVYDDYAPSYRRLVREQYVQRQEGNCHHCHEPLNGPPSKEVQLTTINLALFPPNFLTHPVHLHHSRQTGLTIGAVHARCNAYLWQYLGE